MKLIICALLSLSSLNLYANKRCNLSVRYNGVDTYTASQIQNILDKQKKGYDIIEIDFSNENDIIDLPLRYYSKLRFTESKLRVNPEAEYMLLIHFETMQPDMCRYNPSLIFCGNPKVYGVSRFGDFLGQEAYSLRKTFQDVKKFKRRNAKRKIPMEKKIEALIQDLPVCGELYI